jgi:hypothetical protein
MSKEKINPGLKALAVPVADLHEDPANARLHGERNVSAIKNSLAEFGQQKPIVILTNGKVIAGNGTLRAALALGWEKIAAVRFDTESEAQATAFAIADNRTAELATWDDAVLALNLKAIEVEFPKLEVTGFNLKEIENLFDPPKTNDNFNQQEYEIVFIISCMKKDSSIIKKEIDLLVDKYEGIKVSQAK